MQKKKIESSSDSSGLEKPIKDKKVKSTIGEDSDQDIVYDKEKL